MMRENLIHVIASDAHDTVVRPYNLNQALNILKLEFGTEYADYLIQNAERIFKGEKVITFKN